MATFRQSAHDRDLWVGDYYVDFPEYHADTPPAPREQEPAPVSELEAFRKERYEERKKKYSASDAVAETMSLMRRGRREVRDGLFREGERWGSPFLVTKCREPSGLGPWSYRVAYLLDGTESQKNAAIVATYYSTLVGAAQGSFPKTFDLLTGGRTIIVETDGQLEQTEETVARFQAVSAGEDPGSHFLNSGCKRCGWHDRCHSDAIASGSLCMISGIRRLSIQQFKEEGVETLSDLATARLETVQQVSQYRWPEAAMRAMTQAVAYAKGTPLVVGEPSEIPGRDHVEVVVDFEGLGIDNYGDAVLWAAMVRRGRSHRFVQEIAKRPTQASIGAAFRRFRKQLRAIAPDGVIYHFGAYDRRQLEALGADSLARRTFDLSPIVQRRAAIPEKSMSLKSVAASLGIEMSTGLDGRASIAVYHQWLRAPRSAPQRARLMRRYLAYNKDDLKATFGVLDWLRGAQLV